MSSLNDGTLTHVLVYKDERETLPYDRIVVPSSMRSPLWNYFGFPADEFNNILTRSKIVCKLCRAHIAYNKNTTNLSTHLNCKHADVVAENFPNGLTTLDGKKRTPSNVLQTNDEKRIKLDPTSEDSYSQLDWSIDGDVSLLKLNARKTDHPTGIATKCFVIKSAKDDEANKTIESNAQIKGVAQKRNFDENYKLIITSDEFIETLECSNEEYIGMANDDCVEMITETCSLNDDDPHDGQESIKEDFLSEEYLSQINGEAAIAQSPEHEIDNVVERKEDSVSVKDQSCKELTHGKIVDLKHRKNTQSKSGEGQKITKITDPPDLVHQLKQFLIKDFVSPSIVDGGGFRELIKSIAGTKKIPSASEIEKSLEIDYFAQCATVTSKVKLILSQQSFCLSFNKCNNNESVAISAHFLTAGSDKVETLKKQIICIRSDYTKFFRELGPNLTNCSAFLVNFEPTDDDLMKIVSKQKGIPIIETFSSILENAVRKCLQITTVRKALESIEQIYSAALSDDHSISVKLTVFNTWLQQFALLTQFIEEVDQMEIDDRHSVLKLVAVVETILEYLRPLKNCLDVLAMENTSWASVMKPVAQQLINQHYLKTDEQGQCAYSEIDALQKELKQIISDDLLNKISDNWFLTVASFLDPRFQNHTAIDDLKRIRVELENSISGNDINLSSIKIETKCKTVKNDKGPGLSSLFTNLPVTAKTKTPKNRFEIEFRSYTEDVNLDLEQCPLAWWSKSEFLYPNIKKSIQKYFCVPLFADDMHQLPLEDQLIFNTRRYAAMETDVNRKLLWLHYNTA